MPSFSANFIADDRELYFFVANVLNFDLLSIGFMTHSTPPPSAGDETERCDNCTSELRAARSLSSGVNGV